MFTNYSVSTESVFGTTYQRKFKLMYHMTYACFKNLSKNFLQNSEIPLRLLILIMLIKRLRTCILSYIPSVIHTYHYYYILIFYNVLFK